MFRLIPNSQVDQPGRHSGNVGYTGLIWQDYVNRLLIELCYKAYRDKDMEKSSDTYTKIFRCRWGKYLRQTGDAKQTLLI